MRVSVFVCAGLGALLATTALATPALAQEASIVPFPVRQFADENGVDLLTGVFTVLTPAVRIGSPEMGLSYTREVRVNLFRDTMMSNIRVSGSTYTVGLGTQSEVFTLSAGVFTPVEQNGSTLTLSGTTYTYTRADGTVAIFNGGGPNYFFGNARGIVISSLTHPSGRALIYHYRDDSYVDFRGNTRFGRRLQGVTVNTGYLIHFTYASDDASVNFGGGWATMTQVKGLNSATDGCSPIGFTCTVTGRPVIQISTPVGGTHDYTDGEGRTTSFTVTSGGVTGIKLPGSASNNVSVTYTSGKVSSITRFGVTTGYSYADAGGVRTVTVTRPGGATRVVTFDISKSLMLSDENETDDKTIYEYDTNNRPTKITRPLGDYTELTYDSRGNVTETEMVAKPGSPLASIIATASYPATCTNAKTCNRPTNTTDSRGNVTDYTYDSTHGGVLTVTAPAPATGAARPQTRLSYTRLDANGSPSASGIVVPTGSSACQSGSAPSCLGTANEAKASVAYGYGLQLASTTNKAGDNSVSATVAMTYDAVGNLLTVDRPLPGTADTTRNRYNQNRELVGVVGPDPDGGGILKNRARRITIDNRGLVTKVENGTTIGQSDSAWAAFAPLDEVRQEYDSNRRPSVSRLVSGATTYAVSQNGYDSRGRLQCVAQRMNPAIYGSLPASACTLGSQGTFGPDRIAETIYDAASRVTQLKVAVGTTDAATERTLTYTDNGKLHTLKDANDNLTTYEYDGHERLARTRYPVTTKGANQSSTTDDELLAYDAASNVTGFTNRAGQTIGFTYDALNRPISKLLPGSEPDVAYGYDNLRRLTEASQTGNSLSFTYDALGRNLTQAGPQWTVASEWDAAGRRTKLTYPGSGLYLLYDYLVTGETTKIRENGVTSGVGVLATYAYDNLGNRTSRTFGNGVVQAYAYDPVSRLASLTNNLSGTANDLSATFAYNPASQIGSTTRTGDTYAWTGHHNGTWTGTPNGLNQLTSYGGKSLSHDSKGNVTAFGTENFTYSSENLLLTGPNNTSLGHDPMMRLHQVISGGSTTRFVYDGLDRIAEDNGSSALQRRYVFGPSVDEPIVWYEGSGTPDRRFLSSDERGSIVSVTNSSSVLLGINRYDEFGQPQSNNLGTWGYTGQAWMPTIGVWYYKARMYEPELGRFLQPDPIGYKGGANLYAYVLNEPISLTDPSGLVVCTGSRINVSSCANSPDPVSCSGACGEFYGSDPGQGAISRTSEDPFTIDPGVVACAQDLSACDQAALLPASLVLTLPGWHHYNPDPNIICAAQFQCSAAEVAAVYPIANNQIPGGPNERIISGNTYSVYLHGLWIGNVTSTVSRNGLSVLNEAQFLHIMGGPFGGWVGREAFQDPSGTWFSHTEGFGSNWNIFLGFANQLFAPSTWRTLDAQIRRRLERR